MSTINARLGRLLAGCGAALLVASLFMPWSDRGSGGSQSGWELLTMSDVLLLITALFGLAAASTGGRFGFFRPDVSLNGATDIVALVASILLVWLVAFDWPSGASREVGVYLALAGAVAITTGTGDFRVRTIFPRMPDGGRLN
jgi:hypothetical protein